MLAQTREADLTLFVNLSKEERPNTVEDVPTYVVIPAFLVSELKTAFLIGLLPGSSYRFTVTGEPGDRLSFATMFVQSNDLFFGPDDNGLALFGLDGAPLAGDITAQVMLWDAGTEANQRPGVGPDQPLRQSGADTGADDVPSAVRLVNDGFSYPNVNNAIRVTVMAE